MYTEMPSIVLSPDYSECRKAFRSVKSFFIYKMSDITRIKDAKCLKMTWLFAIMHR